MAILCMLYGQSGTGKSTSLRNFTADDVAIINVSGKPMPFRGGAKSVNSNSYQQITKWLPAIKQPSIVIDDATYLMVDEFMSQALVKGYEKYNIMAKNFSDLIESARKLPDDKIVYFIGHSEQMDDGREHFKTIGKMLDNYVTLEGKFAIVLKTVVVDGEYFFATRNSGMDTVKTPLGMFEDDRIPNDLKLVDDRIREYYSMTGTTEPEAE